ncbi:MAG: hypothetical protein SV375_13145 [Thermodesulfobacteriota bacterium]|nr:hypothetical protein [Thermodesulfobacteriota bacterium]
MGINLVSIFWGFAEATLFFIVPDLFLSATGMYNLRKGIVACLWALAGALMGGIVMYHWGVLNMNSALTSLDAIPAISPDLINRVHADLAEKGCWAVLMGPLLGTPYKIYAVQASAAGVGLMAFILISIPARIIRFMGVTILVSLLITPLKERLSFIKRLILLFLGWIAFYLFYFIIMPN